MEEKQGVEILLEGPASRGATDPSRSDDQDQDNLDVGTSGAMRSRKRTKHGRYISDITLAEVQQFTHLPAHVACEKLGLGLTSFKRVCRSLGIQTWPYRKELGGGGARDTSFEDSRARGGMQRTNSMHNQNGGLAQPRQAAGPSTSASPPSTAAFVAAIHGLAGLRPAGPTPAVPTLAAAASLFGGAPSAASGEEGVLERLCRNATPATLVTLLEKARRFSAEMKTALGVSIIDDSAVDLLHYVAVRLRDTTEPVHAPQPTWGAVRPPPPLSPHSSTSVPLPGQEPAANGGNNGNGAPHQQDAMTILTALAAAYAGAQGGNGSGGDGDVPPLHSAFGPQ